MQCWQCQTENIQGARFCQQCGSALTQTCSRCRTALPVGARFCIECGTPTGAAAAGSGSTHATAAEAVAPSRPVDRPRDPRAYTPPHLVEKILGSRSAMEGERKQVSVLFADIKESMSLAESVDPERWHEIMDGFFTILTEGVHRFEGSVNQFTGDGIMALFGVPIAHEDHAQRACYSALHLQARLAEYAEAMRRERGMNFSIRMGINSGEVVVGRIGDDLRMDYTAQGHTVGLAQRMESLAAADRIYLSENTARLVRDYFELRALGTFQVKGVREPLEVFELEAAGARRTRLDVSRARGLTKFVGRDAEMQVLEEALEAVRAGRSRVIGLTAEGGSGKSRMTYEFTERCRARGLPVYTAHCVAHGRMIPFLPVLELLREFNGIEESDNSRRAREKIAGRLLLADERQRDTLPLIFDFLGVPDPSRPAPPLEPEIRRRMLFSALAALMDAQSEPEVVVVEDLHWIDGASEGFLQGFLEMIQRSPCLLLLNWRPEYDAAWLQGHADFRLLPLEPLGEAAMNELLADVLGSDPSVLPLAERIREATGGNPFFIEEMVYALAEAGSLEGRRGGYRLVRPLEDVILPPTVHALLAARIDHLGEELKGLLETAAVIGKEFEGRVLQAVAGMEPAALDRALTALEEAGFLYATQRYPDAQYAFRHPLTQEVAYRAQLRDRRTRVHRAVAEIMTELHGEHACEHAALLAHHWEGGGDWLEAARCRRRAAEEAESRDLEEAHRNWQALIDALGKLGPSRESYELAIAAAIGMLGICWRLGRPREEADRLFAWGADLAQASGDRTARARMELAYGTYRSFIGDVEESLVRYDVACELAAEAGDYALELELLARRSYSNLLAGNLEVALELNRQSTGLMGGDRRDPRVPVSDYIFFRGAAALPLIYLGRLDEAARLIETSLNLAIEAGELRTVNSMRGLTVSHAWFSGDPAQALASARAQVNFAEQIVSPTLRISAYDSLGVALTLNEDFDGAVEAFETALGAARESGTLLQSEALVLANMAEACRGRGDLVRALSAAEEAVRVAAARRTAMHECRANLILGRVLLRGESEGRLEQAEVALDRAMSIVARTGARAYEPFVRLELAELARQRGAEDAFHDELERACAVFQDIGATAHSSAWRQLCGPPA
jgi:class 3 adenylate cyclase/tetratricopeptide (TPR) repeat protein